MADPYLVATWNINGVVRRLPLLLAWLSVVRPRVVALQETKATEADFPHDAFAAAGYGSLHVGQRTWNGVALLARDTQPVAVRRALPGDDADTTARYLEAAVDGILYAALYAPNGNPQPGPKFDAKLLWFERLLAHARSLADSGLPVALIGDFNVVPTPLDLYATRSYDDNALVQPAVRDGYRRLLEQGWTDALRSLHPEERLYTFWDYLRNRWGRDAGLRIDHLLVSDALRPRLLAAGVDRDWRGVEGASDHAPVWMRLRKR